MQNKNSFKVSGLKNPNFKNSASSVSQRQYIIEPLEKLVNICEDFFVSIMTKMPGVSVMFRAFLV